MKSCLRFLPTAILASALTEGCESDDFEAAQVTAIDCYSMLPEDVSGDQVFLATPTYTDPVETDAGILEQFQIAFKNDVDQIEDLQEEALKNWVGIAYDSSEADPTDPSKDWNPDYVFNVAFFTTIPEFFAEYRLETQFDEITAKTMFAYVDTEVAPSSFDEINMVITNQCENLVYSANWEEVFPLTNH